MLKAFEAQDARDARIATKKAKKAKASKKASVTKTFKNTVLKPSKPRRMAFTPKKVDIRTAVNGKQYIYSRGTIVYRRKSFTYTVMVPFFQFHKFRDAVNSMQAETPIEIEGTRQQMQVTKKNGKVVTGGVYIEANRLLGILDKDHATNGSEEPSRTLPEHERKGHYRRQHYGPGNKLTKVIWIDDVKVNAVLKAA